MTGFLIALIQDFEHFSLTGSILYTTFIDGRQEFLQFSSHFLLAFHAAARGFAAFPGYNVLGARIENLMVKIDGANLGMPFILAPFAGRVGDLLPT